MTDEKDLAAIATDNAARYERHDREWNRVRDSLAENGISADRVVEVLRGFEVATPSWALGSGGTRFGRFPRAGEPRDLSDKLADAALLNALTGTNGSISLHIPWDDPADPSGLREEAESLGLGFDAVNSNTFQDNPSTTRDSSVSYKFGSMAHRDPAVRGAAIEHNVRCIELGTILGSRALTVWLGDGTNHPGQANFRSQFERVADCLGAVHRALPADWSLYTEHKPYEPAFYSTVNQDWGSSLLLAQAAGPRAKCLVDLGHHLPNANIEQVVSRLAMAQRLGGFHFNDSKYGDDDLTAGSIKPYQLFLIWCELLDVGDDLPPDLAYMIDASHNVKDPLEDLLQSTEAISLALAQALLVDRPALREAQAEDDPVKAEEVLHDAYRTDVRPLVAEARRRNGAALRPLQAFRSSGYRARVARTRIGAYAVTGL